jgi:hypothetical protein
MLTWPESVRLTKRVNMPIGILGRRSQAQARDQIHGLAWMGESLTSSEFERDTTVTVNLKAM